jgi:hypothetical protein
MTAATSLGRPPATRFITGLVVSEVALAGGASLLLLLMPTWWCWGWSVSRPRRGRFS